MAKRRSYFPAANRFLGILEPSPTGSYYNPARYAGLPPEVQRRAQRNLSTVYNQDIQFNRLANPRFQTEQDTGASAASPVGSGRATPDTVRNYLATYGTVRNGLRTVVLPSGGSVTVKDSPSYSRQNPRGLPSGGISNAFGFNRPSPDVARQIGFTGDASAITNKPLSQQTPYEQSFALGNMPAVQQPQTGLGYQIGQGLARATSALPTLATSAVSALRNMFGGNSTQQATVPPANLVPDTRPRRYFDDY